MIRTLKSAAGRFVGSISRAISEASARRNSPFGAAKFEQRAPDHRNAIDLFAGRWATDLSMVNAEWRGGRANLVDDARPRLAAQYLGTGSGRIDGMSVLELGPLEGLHSRQLEQLGASRVLAIEANVEAYLKCLIMKEALGMRNVNFMLGDFNLFLANASQRFDLVFCVGVLYHMEDPLTLIRNIARVADKCFVWTHYHDLNEPIGRQPSSVSVDGFSATYFRNSYRDRAQPNFWGGNKLSSSWMRRDEIVAAFRHFGFERVEIVGGEPVSANGPNFCLAASKSASPTELKG